MTRRRPVPLVRSLLLVIAACLSVFLSVTSSMAAQTGAESGPLRMEDIFEVEIAADPQISPDGRWVVYVRQRADIMTRRPVFEPVDRGRRRVGSPAAHRRRFHGQFAALVARRDAARVHLEPERGCADPRPLDGFGRDRRDHERDGTAEILRVVAGWKPDRLRQTGAEARPRP